MTKREGRVDLPLETFQLRLHIPMKIISSALSVLAVLNHPISLVMKFIIIYISFSVFVFSHKKECKVREKEKEKAMNPPNSLIHHSDHSSTLRLVSSRSCLYWDRCTTILYIAVRCLAERVSHSLIIWAVYFAS